MTGDIVGDVVLVTRASSLVSEIVVAGPMFCGRQEFCAAISSPRTLPISPEG